MMRHKLEAWKDMDVTLIVNSARCTRNHVQKKQTKLSVSYIYIHSEHTLHVIIGVTFGRSITNRVMVYSCHQILRS